MATYRRIEIRAFHRRVTIDSGEWQRQVFNALPPQTEEGVSLNDNDVSEPIEADSPEGQLILMDAIRSLEQRLSPPTCAKVGAGGDYPALNRSNRNSFYLKLRSIYQLIRSQAPHLDRKEK